MSVRRSHLYVPGDREELLLKAGQRGADALIIDLEDAVVPSRRDEAREIVRRIVASGITGADEIWIRINPFSTDDGKQTLADLDVAVASGVAGVIVAKVENADEINAMVKAMESRESKRGLPGTLGVAALLESATGLSKCKSIARCRRMTRLQLGESDLSADLGVELGDDESELSFARQRVIVESRAAGIEPPVGPVSTNFTDLERLRVSTERIRRLGFVGRAVIHPAQISIVNEVFTPTADQLAKASKLVERFVAAQSSGTGVIVDDSGRMIDEAVIRTARRVLELGGAS